MIFVSGCNVTTIPSNRSIEDIDSPAEAQSIVREGMTMEQVEAKLGEPNHKMTTNNQVVWNYTEMGVNMNPLNTLFATGVPDTKSIAVFFDENRRVSRVMFSKTENR